MNATTEKPRLTRAQKKARNEQLRTYRLACALGRPAQCSGDPRRTVAMGRFTIRKVLGYMRGHK